MTVIFYYRVLFSILSNKFLKQYIDNTYILFELNIKLASYLYNKYNYKYIVYILVRSNCINILMLANKFELLKLKTIVYQRGNFFLCPVFAMKNVST